MHLFAYLDPGTGSMFIQAIFGAALAAIVVMRTFFRKALIKARLAFSSRKDIVDEEA